MDIISKRFVITSRSLLVEKDLSPKSLNLKLKPMWVTSITDA